MSNKVKIEDIRNFWDKLNNSNCHSTNEIGVVMIHTNHTVIRGENSYINNKNFLFSQYLNNLYW